MQYTNVKRIWIEYNCPKCKTAAREDVVFERIKGTHIGKPSYISRCPNGECSENIEIDLKPI